MTLLGQFRHGRWTHAVRLRPDLRAPWRSVCMRARSEAPPSRWGDDTTAPGCPYCIRDLRQVVEALEVRT